MDCWQDTTWHKKSEKDIRERTAPYSLSRAIAEVTGWMPLSTSMNMVKFKLQYGGSKRSVTLLGLAFFWKGLVSWSQRSQYTGSVRAWHGGTATSFAFGQYQAEEALGQVRVAGGGTYVRTPVNRETSLWSIFMLFLVYQLQCVI